MSKEIIVNPRTDSGKGAAGRARRSGHVPAVLYGKNTENVLLYAPIGELDSAKLKAGDDVTLVLGDQKIAAKVMEVQINYLKSHILHLDFCRA